MVVTLSEGFVTVTVADPVFPVPVPPPVTETIEYVLVEVGETEIETGDEPVAVKLDVPSVTVTV